MPDINQQMKRHNALVLYFFKKMYVNRWDVLRYVFPTYIDLDDILQACYMGLWDALMTFNKGKGAFSSWVALNIRANVYRLRKYKKAIVPVDQYVKGNVVDYESVAIDTRFADHVDVVSESDSLSVIHDLANSELKERRRLVCLEKLKGLSHDEVAKNLDITRQRVHQIWSEFLVKARAKLEYLEMDVGGAA